MSIVIQQWRTGMIVLCVGAALVGCSGRSSGVGDVEDIRLEVFSEVPAGCDVVEEAVGVSLRMVGGAVFDPDARLGTTPGGESHDLQCGVTFEDPIPAGDVAAGSPMSRSVAIRLAVNKTGTPVDEQKALVDYDHLTSDAVVGPETVAGVGQDSMVWTEVEDGSASILTKTRIDNLWIDVAVSGRNWQGENAFPTGDSPQLRADLRAASDTLTSALATTLPPQLPRTELGRWEQLPDPTPHAETTPPDYVDWNPCTLAGQRAEAAGLPAEPRDRDPAESSCSWRTPEFDLIVEADHQGFVLRYFDPDHYRDPRRVTVAGRDAMRLLWKDSEDYCLLAFDTPFGARDDGLRMGSVKIEISVEDPKSVDQTCATLTRVAEALVPSLPADR
ncbi:hypothetical protein [Nocardia sp. SSK8]|uniref:hypothetical protein n=1 Tax=Nocardia sp. SSK8 TaxID=3120154 RepID=UPI00300A62BE